MAGHGGVAGDVVRAYYDHDGITIYHAQTMPLIDYYSKWAASGDSRAPRSVRVQGTGTVDDCRQRLFAALGK